MGIFSKLFGSLKSDPHKKAAQRDTLSFQTDSHTANQAESFYVKNDDFNEKLIDNFSEIDPYPAQFYDLRVLLRNKIREANKTNNTELGLYATIKLYNLGAFAAFLYGFQEGYSAVGGLDYERAVPKVKKYGDKFTLDYLGKISDSKFLSDIDYKNIEKYGSAKDPITIKQIRKIITS